MNSPELVLLLAHAGHILLTVTSSQEVTQATKVPTNSSKWLVFPNGLPWLALATAYTAPCVTALFTFYFVRLRL